MPKPILVLSSLLVALWLGACSGSSASDEPCVVDFFGNTVDSAHPARCAVLSAAAASDAGAAASAPDRQLTVSYQATSAASKIGSLIAAIDLGPAPTAGTFSSEMVATWSVTALSNAASNCAFGAGDSSVPPGSFTLDLTGVDPAAGTAHGTLEAELSVYAPAATDCGPGETEIVDVRF